MFKCDICDQEFKNEASYQKHLLTSKHITNKTIHDLKHQIEEMKIKINELEKENEKLLLKNNELTNDTNKEEDKLIPLINNLQRNTTLIEGLSETLSSVIYFIAGEIGIVLITHFLKEFYPSLVVFR